MVQGNLGCVQLPTPPSLQGSWTNDIEDGRQAEGVGRPGHGAGVGVVRRHARVAVCAVIPASGVRARSQGRENGGACVAPALVYLHAVPIPSMRVAPGRRPELARGSVCVALPWGLALGGCPETQNRLGALDSYEGTNVRTRGWASGIATGVVGGASRGGSGAGSLIARATVTTLVIDSRSRSMLPPDQPAR